MKVRWLEKNLDLNQLCSCIDNFFKREGFSVATQESNGHILILATKKYDDTPLTIVITVEGVPSDFSVQIECKELSKRSLAFAQSLVFFGLGWLSYKKMKLISVYDRLEAKFWMYMEEVVSKLARSKL